MSFQKILIRIVSFNAVLLALSAAAYSQSVYAAPRPVAYGSNLYCAGYIQASSISTGNYIIGAQNEADGWNYAQNDHVFINMGRDKGVSVGDRFSVVRPRGAVKSAWSRKSDLGFFVQEVGDMEVVNVKDNVSVARIKVSCETFRLGDLVQLSEKRTSPVYDPGEPMDVFADPSGKATGRILMSRDGAEMLTRDYVAYVDLGADDNVRVGDRLTIFRPLAKGNITLHPDRESVSSRDYGFQSDVYKGGKFSNQSARKSGDKADGQEVRTRDVRNDRPDFLRKVVGEAVIVNVKERTATVIITRTAQEIHTGDWVEIK
ncbi:MAG: hypothetical protein AB7J13_09560 [Pyrinomonadaceae bacterium]